MPDDPRIRVEGVSELATDGDWRLPRRLPDGGRSALHPELRRVADMAAGVRLDFTTDASAIVLAARVTMPSGLSDPVAPFDVVVNGQRVSRQTVIDTGELRIADLGSTMKDVTVWLPHFGVTALGELTALGATFVAPPPIRRPHWITYGSSITQCQQALGPSETWPALVSSREDWRLTCLGFAGQCHLDPQVAQHIRDTPADIISLCLGINVWGASTFPRRTLAPAIAGFLATIRDGHPDTPMLVMTPIASPNREDRPNEDGLTLAEIRGIVRDVVRWRQNHGDPQLVLLDGPDVLGINEAPLLGDGLHPSPLGYEILADRIAPQLAALLAHRNT